MSNENIVPPFTIHFPLDSSVQLSSEQPILNQTVRYLHNHPDLPIEIEGYADQPGSIVYNQRLGYLRAQSIREHPPLKTMVV